MNLKDTAAILPWFLKCPFKFRRCAIGFGDTGVMPSGRIWLPTRGKGVGGAMDVGMSLTGELLVENLDIDCTKILE